MRIKLGSVAAIAAVAALLTAAGGAHAATEFGDNCVANATTGSTSVTLIELANPDNPLPTAAPSAGIITKWRVNSPSPPFAIPLVLKLLRPTGPGAAQIVGEASGNLLGGGNSFDARIPVQAGDRLGLFGTSETFHTLYCQSTGAVGTIGAVMGGGGTVGTPVTYMELASKLRVPLSAVVEPDADNDGFGDESQDKCPAAAAVQTPCPVVVVDTVPLLRKGKVLVLVSTSITSEVTVSGSANLPKKSAAARSSAQAKLRSVTKSVTGGKFARFTLKFPASLKSAIAGLAPGRSITLNLQAKAPNVAGAVFIDKAKLKLKG